MNCWFSTKFNTINLYGITMKQKKWKKKWKKQKQEKKEKDYTNMKWWKQLNEYFVIRE